MAIGAVDHVGILVDDLEEAKRFLGETLGLELERQAEMPPLGVEGAFFRCGPILLEVFQHRRDDSPVPPLADGAGARIDHVAIEVESIDRAVGGLADAGVALRDVGTGGRPLPLGGSLHVWTEPASSDGVTYQLIEKGAG